MRVVRHDTVDSTSERAFAALAAGEARDGDAHVARHQTAGRGRRGRRWLGTPGESLLVSFVHLPPPPAPPPEALTMAAGVALKEALEELGAEGLRLDWPNDVVADGAKLAGILTEARGLDPARPAFVVGVGVNVGQEAFPEALVAERRVTSLALLGLLVAPDDVLAALSPRLLSRLALARTEPERLEAAYLEALGLRDREVVLVAADKGTGDRPGGRLEGRLHGLSAAHGAVLVLADGEERAVPLARIRSLAPAPADEPR